MNFLTTAEQAKIWNVSQRRVAITLKSLAEKTKDMVFKGGTSITKCYRCWTDFQKILIYPIRQNQVSQERAERNN